jgi:hypothetical protein
VGKEILPLIPHLHSVLSFLSTESETLQSLLQEATRSDQAGPQLKQRNSPEDIHEHGGMDAILDCLNPRMALRILHRAERFSKCQVTDDVECEPVESLAR